MIALIVLVVMTLAAVALVRSVDTTNQIAGNMSFREGAVHSGERSTELAINEWIARYSGKDPATGKPYSKLWNDEPLQGYYAARKDPSATQSWDTFWAELGPKTVAADAAGNQVSYVIHRLCEFKDKAPHEANCSKPPAAASSGGSFSAGAVSTITSDQVYYRVTTRVVGPRNTVAYIQTIVAQ
ncbi:MAG: hypothetical protein E6Q42_10105 [Dechloromonas sp.]|nr:MAG: hypothetical protein E6Q42_10105 [Dechloromonas sp.]